MSDAPDNAGLANDSLGNCLGPDWSISRAPAESDSDDDPAVRVPVDCVPRSWSFDNRWRQLSCLDGGDRIFRHTRHAVLFGQPQQLWTDRCDYYRKEVRIRGIEISWTDGERCDILVSIFRVPRGAHGRRAADMVRLPNLGWTTDRATQTYRFTGGEPLQVVYPEQSFDLRHLGRGSRVLYVVEPSTGQNEDAGSRLLDADYIGKPAPFHRIRFLYGVPLSVRGRARYGPRRGGPVRLTVGR